MRLVERVGGDAGLAQGRQGRPDGVVPARPFVKQPMPCQREEQPDGKDRRATSLRAVDRQKETARDEGQHDNGSYEIAQPSLFYRPFGCEDRES